MSLGLDLGTTPPTVAVSALFEPIVYLKTSVKYQVEEKEDGTPVFDDVAVQINVTLADFCELTKYVLTNTDLLKNDPRIHLLTELAKLNVIEGRNGPTTLRLGVQ